MELRAQIEELESALTPAERKLASTLLADYPFAGLQTIQTLADKTGVSAPSITRFVAKLGCQGYQDFQHKLIGELKEWHRSPVELHGKSSHGANFLEAYVERASQLVRAVPAALTQVQFERICSMVADERRAIYLIGGRISDPMAQHFSRHLRQIRRDVFHIPPDPEVWPEYILRMKARDVFVVFDFRRYQPRLEQLVRTARQASGIEVLLFTDKWLSPASSEATEVIALSIDNGTAWDTYIGAMVTVDAMITHISERDWNSTSSRIRAWDALRLDKERKSTK
ncbi:MurR/RpiR family transcriptional regulator [Mesorhizobium sp. BH1-1-5]|uniref:MurR/RpiR family transcriptional regulator n=1 Tax=unclassified Mesorhizobium TaxID=325217 RepID=UPI00112C884A|nr:MULTISPECIES: MurR/RpiR family transcriptional regulator [unclassified Mesorhizobium]MBZ9989002.1 MurR/RpiR family transcriptional regulator [Mesorhizobium sp. BH1-1-5]TPJ72886.1 MurR/RpiR family transcriptional regulator [Mesorhizobium sp. B2-7-1]